jgi:hypothetical protein
MASWEAPIRHFVSVASQLTRDKIAAVLDRDDAVCGAVSDEDAGLPNAILRKRASRGECDHRMEQIAFREPEPESESGPGRESADPNATPINRATSERALKGSIDEP